MRTNGAFLRTFDSPRHLQGRHKQQTTALTPTGTVSPQPPCQVTGPVQENGVKSYPNTKINGKRTESKLSSSQQMQMCMTSSSSGQVHDDTLVQNYTDLVSACLFTCIISSNQILNFLILSKLAHGSLPYSIACQIRK